MTEAKRIPRLEDVAARAGVSPATVSRYFNNPSLLAPQTVERIAQAVEQTGYVRNIMAGSLATSRSGIISVLVPDLELSIINVTVEAMINELANDGYVVMLGLTGHDFARLLPLIEDAMARRALGLVMTGALKNEPARAKLRAQGMNVIETWGLPEDPVDVAIGCSHLEIGRELARFVNSRGYRRVHLLNASGARATERRDGFVAEWAMLGGSEPTGQTLGNQTRFGQARAAFRAMRELPKMPDVVVCSSDWLAQGMVAEAANAGLKVPDDLGVVGFGNLNIAGEMRPSLTTVDIDGARIGRETAAILRRRAMGEAPSHQRIDVGFRLIARESA